MESRNARLAIRTVHNKGIWFGHQSGLMRVDPKYYREQAEHSRALAKRARIEEIRKHLLNVAKQYDELAKEAEKRR